MSRLLTKTSSHLSKATSDVLLLKEGGDCLRKVIKARGLGLRSLSQIRSISFATNLGNWKKETPIGGITELYTYHPDSQTVWPDPNLGVFSKVDGRFSLPGHTGAAPDPSKVSDIDGSINSNQETIELSGLSKSDLVSKPSNKEHQAQVLYTAHDYIQYTAGAEEYVCTGMLASFPSLQTSFTCELFEAPRLIRKDAAHLFPDRLDLQTGPLSIITMSQKTKHDMSCWSDAMEEERDELTLHFFSAAKEICSRLKQEGHWADFIDPSAGKPYFAPHTNMTMFETDEKYRLLGFRIEDLGCCKIICHKDFGRNVFVGTIFTNAHVSSGTVNDVFEDLKLKLSSTATPSPAPTTE